MNCFIVCNDPVDVWRFHLGNYTTIILFLTRITIAYIATMTWAIVYGIISHNYINELPSNHSVRDGSVSYLLQNKKYNFVKSLFLFKLSFCTFGFHVNNFFSVLRIRRHYSVSLPYLHKYYI